MKQSTIQFKINLDNKNIPEKITWHASDKSEKPMDTKSISLALWDDNQKNTLRIDLWTKEMPLYEMKQFYIDCLAGLAQSAMNATSDRVFADKINSLCDELTESVKKNNNLMDK